MCALGTCQKCVHNAHKGMRSHKQIVEKVGPDKLATIFGVPLSTTRSWARRDSIPAEFWLGFRLRQWATYEELARAVANVRVIPSAASNHSEQAGAL
jgi:hypothetical protein